MVLIRFISGLMLLLGAALASFTEIPVLSVIGLLILIGGGVVFLVFYRCPHCHRLLPWRAPLDMEYCPFCGEFIE